MKSLIASPPPQVHRDITCCHNFTLDYVEEAYEEKNQGGVCCLSVCLSVGLATGIAKFIHYRVVCSNTPDISLADP